MVTNCDISPLISILSHLNNTDQTTTLPHKANVHFLYSTKLHPRSPTLSQGAPILDQILFLARLRQLARSLTQSTRFQQVSLSLFVTGSQLVLDSPPSDLRIHNRRVDKQDLQEAISFPGDKGGMGPQNENDMTNSTVCYVCGPKPFTAAVETDLNALLHRDGDHRKRCVFHEMWW